MDEFQSYLMSVFALKGFKNAVELGCTTGKTTRFLNQLCPTLGVDISKEYIKRAKCYDKNGEYLVADVRKYKPKKRFDVAVTQGLLIHIKDTDIKKTIQNIFKIAKHGLFTESSVEEYYDTEYELKYDNKKYWEHRAKNPDKESDLPMRYYYCHDYPFLFGSLGIKYQTIVTFDERTKTRMYLCQK